MSEQTGTNEQALFLNFGAFKALVGGSDTPEADIAALLRSGYDIEPEVRAMIADALEGRSDGVELRVRGLGKTKLFRSYLGRRINLRRAQRVFFLQRSGATYDNAVEQVAGEEGVSESTIGANVTFAKAMQKWCDEASIAILSTSDLDNSELEMAFLYADAANKPPMGILRRAIELRSICDSISQAIHRAAGEP